MPTGQVSTEPSTTTIEPFSAEGPAIRNGALLGLEGIGS